MTRMEFCHLLGNLVDVATRNALWDDKLDRQDKLPSVAEVERRKRDETTAWDAVVAAWEQR